METVKSRTDRILRTRTELCAYCAVVTMQVTKNTFIFSECASFLHFCKILYLRELLIGRMCTLGLAALKIRSSRSLSMIHYMTRSPRAHRCSGLSISRRMLLFPMNLVITEINVFRALSSARGPSLLCNLPSHSGPNK